MNYKYQNGRRLSAHFASGKQTEEGCALVIEERFTQAGRTRKSDPRSRATAPARGSPSRSIPASRTDAGRIGILSNARLRRLTEPRAKGSLAGGLIRRLR